MEKDHNIMQMVIFIKESLSMVLLKDTVNINGLMDLIIKVILSKAIEMDMVFGNQKEANNNIKGTIYLIENMDMASMIGEIILFIKANICKI